MRTMIIGLTLLSLSCGSATSFTQNSTRAADLGGSGNATNAAPPLGSEGSSSGKTAPVLSSLSIAPSHATLPLGESQQFTATGHYSDGSSKALTATASWKAADGTILHLGAGTGAGLAKASKEGSTTLNVAIGSIAASAPVTVTAAALVSISISSGTTSDGASIPVTATGTYSDGSTADITPQVGWTSAPGSGTFTTTPSGGTVFTPTVTSDGPVGITATLGGVTGTGTITVTKTVLACTSTTAIINSSGTATVTFSGPAPVTYSVAATSANPPASIGTVAASGTGLQASYVAPSPIATTFNVAITATAPDGGTASCEVRLAADGALGVPDDGTTPGLVGNVYPIPAGEQVNSTTFMKAWLTETPIAAILMPTLNVPNTPYQDGFPGYPSLTAWFAIQFLGQIYIPTPGTYTFQAQSDDGSIVYIDGQQVVNDDGVHAITTATGQPVLLTAGWHALEVDYFQGPPIYLAMTLEWQGPNDTSFSIVPPADIARPAPPAN